MRGWTSRVICTLLLAFAASFPVVATTVPPVAPITIPLLTPWIGTTGKPTAATWRHAARFAMNNEIQPGHNLPAPVATVAYVGYTHKALWVHFVARDPDPRDVRVKYRQHDDVNNNNDFVGIIFTPFDETQFGYEFFCSAAGTELDAFRQRSNEYDSYDTIWSCVARRTATGYVVTIRVPFASIKFPHSA